MQCKYLKIRTKKGIKYGYCTLYKKEVGFKCNCTEKEYKTYKPINKRTNRLNKIEKSRYSIIYQDLNKCCVCGKNKDNLHEVFYGSYRIKSIEYGCVIPLCFEHHRLIHDNKDMDLKYKKMFENKFKEFYPNLNFNEIFFYKEKEQ